MEVCKELEILAEEFNKKNATLYIVGGYVRDSLLGLENEDIDICSSLSAQSVCDICSSLNIKTNNINKTLGTIQITFNKHRFEYTQFRKESYSSRGEHTPSDIEFVTDIGVDTLRRDFTINSIYYNILTKEYVDTQNGMLDIKKCLIRTTNSPNITLADDGLRILRGVRMSSLLDFKIEKKTLKALKTYTPLLNKISKERILKELSMLVVADQKHKKDNTHFLKLCNTLCLPRYIFNSSLSNIKKFGKNDIAHFYALPSTSRLVGFYVLVLKKHFRRYQGDNHLAYTINSILGHNGLKESNQNITTTERLYRILQNLEYNVDILNACINYLTLSNAERCIIDAFVTPKAKVRLSDNIRIVKDNNLPLSVHELDICVQDLLDSNIERRYISKILSTLYNQVLNMCVENRHEELLKLAKDLNETFSKIAKEII